MRGSNYLWMIARACPPILKTSLERISIAPMFVAGSGRPINASLTTDAYKTGSFPISARPPGFARNPFRSTPTINLDVRVMKTIPTHNERALLQFGIESFNALNHTNAERQSVLHGWRVPIAELGPTDRKPSCPASAAHVAIRVLKRIVGHQECSDLKRSSHAPRPCARFQLPNGSERGDSSPGSIAGSATESARRVRVAMKCLLESSDSTSHRSYLADFPVPILIGTIPRTPFAGRITSSLPEVLPPRYGPARQRF